MNPAHARCGPGLPHQPVPWRQAGLSLVELLVALALGSLVALAALALMLLARRGFDALDAASQLRDNARFAADLVQRVAGQAGYVDLEQALSGSAAAQPAPATPSLPSVFGFNNAVWNAGMEPDPGLALNGNRSARTAGCADARDTACVNGSDILVLRYQAPVAVAGSTQADRTSINCAGYARDTVDAGQPWVVNVFHVQISGGEPALMCGYQDKAGRWLSSSQPLVEGVESFQVLYGVDGSPDGAAPSTKTADAVPDRYLRADQLAVPGDAVRTRLNWRRVRSLRIGLVLRGALRSGQGSAGPWVYYPLGRTLGSPDDAGSVLTPPADGRLRQTARFTVHLRNDQGV